MPIRIIQGRNPRWRTRLSFPKYTGNFERPRENSAPARKRKGALPFGKQRGRLSVCFSLAGERALKTAPEKFSHLSAVPIPANTKRIHSVFLSFPLSISQQTNAQRAFEEPKISVPVLTQSSAPTSGYISVGEAGWKTI